MNAGRWLTAKGPSAASLLVAMILGWRWLGRVEGVKVEKR